MRIYTISTPNTPAPGLDRPNVRTSPEAARARLLEVIGGWGALDAELEAEIAAWDGERDETFWLCTGDPIAVTVHDVDLPPGWLTPEQLVRAAANVGLDLSCGACAAVFYTGVGLPNDRHTCSR